MGRKPANALRNTALFSPKLRGYVQKRHKAWRDPEVSHRVMVKPFLTDSKVDGELVQRKFAFLFGEICERTRE